MDDATAFEHPLVRAELQWHTPEQLTIIWWAKDDGTYVGSLSASFENIGGKRSIVFHTMQVRGDLQRQRVLRRLCRRMPAWLRARGVEQVVIPRPDGGLDVSERAFELAGFHKDGVAGRRVASMVELDGDGLTEVERIAETALAAEEQAAAEGGTL
jgi:GNAT superfamily N-acetyltransferase